MFVFFAIAVIAGALGLAALPFFFREESDHVLFTNFPKSSLRNLRDHKNLLVLALRELDFDFETGKLSKEDYKSLRDRYEAQAVSVMKDLDAAERQWATIQEGITKRVQEAMAKGDEA